MKFNTFHLGVLTERQSSAAHVGIPKGIHQEKSNFYSYVIEVSGEFERRPTDCVIRTVRHAFHELAGVVTSCTRWGSRLIHSLG